MIELHTLTDGGQIAAEIASVIGDFLNGAEKSLDIALYDFALSDATAAGKQEAREVAAESAPPAAPAARVGSTGHIDPHDSAARGWLGVAKQTPADG